jgi:hypothetical protein
VGGASDLEKRLAETKMLIAQLSARAAPVRPPSAKERVVTGKPKLPEGNGRVSETKRSRATASGNDAGELAKAVAAVTEANTSLEAAKRAKDRERIKTAVVAVANAERRAGQMLIAAAGRLRPLPVGISKAAAKRWRHAAERSDADFATWVVARQKSTLGTIAVCPPRAKVSEWHRDEDGSLTRTITSGGEDQAAVAHAGAA